MLIALFILGLTGIISIKSPYAAVLLLTALISLWIEWSFPVFFDAKIGVVDVAVVGGFLGVIFFCNKGQNDQKIPLKGLIFSYMIISILAYFSNPLIKSNDFLKIIWGAYKTIYVTSTFFLFYMVLNSEKLIQKTVNLVLFSSVFCSLFGIVQGLTQNPLGFKIGTYGESIIFKDHLRGGLRAFGTFTHSNEFAAFLVWPLSISLTLFLLDKEYKYRKYLPFFILIQGGALLFTFSRGGWMGFLLSFIIIGYYSGIYKRISFLIIVLLFPLMGILLHGVFPKMDIIPGNVTARLFSVKEYKTDPAMQPRYDRWDYFYKRSLEKPFTGHGITADESTFDLFSDYAVSPHNTYLSIAVKRGYIALGIIILIIIKLVGGAKYIYVSSYDDYFKAVGLGIYAGLVGLFAISVMFASVLEETQFNILFWFILAVTLRSMQFVKIE
jgi:hypothetical protein